MSIGGVIAVYGVMFLILGIILLMATVPLNKREQELAMLRRARQKKGREELARFHRQTCPSVRRHRYQNTRVGERCW